MLARWGELGGNFMRRNPEFIQFPFDAHKKQTGLRIDMMICVDDVAVVAERQIPRSEPPVLAGRGNSRAVLRLVGPSNLYRIMNSCKKLRRIRFPSHLALHLWGLHSSNRPIYFTDRNQGSLHPLLLISLGRSWNRPERSFNCQPNTRV